MPATPTFLLVTMNSILRLLSALILLKLGAAQNTTCCNAPVNLFALARDLNEQNIFPGLNADYFLITSGTVDDILLIPGIGIELRINTDIIDFPMVWISSESGVVFNYTAETDKPDVLPPPVLLPYSMGLVPVEPERSHVIFECTGISSSPVEVTVNVTLYSEVTGERFCPISFMFGKECLDENSLSSGLREDFQMVDPIQGQVNVPEYTDQACRNGSMTTAVSNDKDDHVILTATLSSIIPLIAVILAATAVGVGIWLVWYSRLRQRTKELEIVAIGKAYTDMHDLWGSYSHRDHEKEFPPERLKTLRELGEGAFGVVYEGVADGIETEGELTQVAIKQLHDMTAVDEFFREVDFMSNLDHPQIVRLLGVCSNQEPYAMIFEYMDLGDLCSFLREAALLQQEGGETVLEKLDLLHCALQVAQGMVYISKKRLVHRDLAARNCLVGTGLVIKIADFGMSRNIYSTDYYRVQGSALLPVRWMAPESIRYGKFSESSDVWSYGVLLWEMFTLGQQPFTGHSNDEVIQLICEGRHLEPPHDSAEVSQVMLDCWEGRVKDRPTFKELCTLLTTLISDAEKETQIVTFASNRQTESQM